jgi:hypothetical protein
VILTLSDAIFSLLAIWSVTSYSTGTCAAFVRVVDAQGSSHYFVVIEVTHCRCGLINVRKFCKAETLRFSSLLIVDQAEI